MTKLLYAFGLALALSHSSCSLANELAGKVVGVSDGDTITVLDRDNHTHKIRLSGIDAPEKRQAFGQRSKQALSDVVFDRTVTVDWSKRDKYGRLVGKVRLANGSDANLRQIELGLAWHYKAYEREQPLADRQTYTVAEQNARKEKIGLWTDPDPVAPWNYRHSR